jgi:hypothetical protein
LRLDNDEPTRWKAQIALTTNQFIVIDTGTFIFAAMVVYFTRAVPKRVLGAAVGGLAGMAVGIGFDVLGDAKGWWHYTTGTTAYGPPLMYVALFLGFGIGLTLIGWRVSRRFGSRGLIGFIAFMAVYGPLRDYVGVALTRGTLQVISSGVQPLIADVLLWATSNTVAQSVMWLISGSPKSDQLARSPLRLPR